MVVISEQQFVHLPQVPPRPSINDFIFSRTPLTIRALRSVGILRARIDLYTDRRTTWNPINSESHFAFSFSISFFSSSFHWTLFYFFLPIHSLTVVVAVASFLLLPMRPMERKNWNKICQSNARLRLIVSVYAKDCPRNVYILPPDGGWLVGGSVCVCSNRGSQQIKVRFMNK